MAGCPGLNGETTAPMESPTTTPPRPRDAARSREAILDAAEALFAERGYEGASLHEIGRRAGVSRGTPGYFFGSKDGLYRATLERVFAAELELVFGAAERAAAAGGAEAALAAAITSFQDFLEARPSFVRLVEREALAGGRLLGATAVHSVSMREGLTATAALLAGGPFRPVDPAHFLLDVLALCWFPIAHAETFARGLGLDPESGEFREARRRHVVELVLRGIKRS